MIKKVLSTFLISALFAVFLVPQMVFAGGGAVDGTDPTGGSCGDWWDTCYGYSWQKYEVVSDISGGVMLHTTTNTGSAVSISTCAVGQTIYNYGFEVHHSGYYGYQVSTQRNKYGVQAPHASSARGAYPGSRATIQNYTVASGYASMDEAKTEFYKMYEYAKNHPDKGPYEGINTNVNFEDAWANVGAFCWDPEVDNPDPIPTHYYSVSNAAAVVAGSGDNSWVTTKIYNYEDGSVSEVNANTLNIPNSDTKVQIRFSHNVYSDIKVTDRKNWTVTRDFSKNIGGRSGSTSGSTAFTGKSGNLYIADSRSEADGSNYYVLRDVYDNVTLNEGYNKFCESITIEGVTTTACVSINVGHKCQGTDCECYGINCPPEPAKPCGLNLPSSYTGSSSSSGTTSVASVVRNLSLTNSYRNFQNAVYAKPTDTVNWCHAYYPGVQYAANTTVTHENYHPEPTEGLWYSNTLNNHTFSAYSDWSNRFSISSHNVSPYYSENKSFSAGMTDAQEVQNKDNIETGQAGETLWETINSGYPTSVSASSGADHSWACHWRCDSDICGEHCCASHEECTETCSGEGESQSCSESCTTVCDAYCCNSCYVDTCYHSNEYYANSRSGTDSDTSYVYVPYNFSNTAAVNISNSVTYAGETMTIGSSTVTVHTKYNNVTQGTYATQVDSAQAKLVGYLSSSSTGTAKAGYGSSDICSALPYKNNSCDELNYYSGMTFNSSARMAGSTDTLGFAGQTYNVYDAKAGDYYCVVVAVYPYTSGSDTNLDASGSRNWYISAPSCRVIAKRPSFQVWGGSVYSEKSISTSVATKNNVRSVYSYTSTGNRNTTIYGSWVEQAVIANGLVSGLASGAASGDLTKAPWSGSKEGRNPNYCTYRVPLSIANYSLSASESICPTYQQTGNAELPNAAVDRDALMSYWWVMDTGYIDKTTVNLATDYVDTRSMQGNAIRYTEPVSTIAQISLTAATIPKGVTHVVRASGDIRIDGNITYQSTNYTTQSEIPKLLIYSEGNITIGCNVDRVDAIVIAEGQVRTCDSYNVNAAANSRQLTVNGMIIADSLVLNRTYGAATSVNSSVPAEIINYDTSAIIWGKGMADANDFETLTTVYQHEIAPRY